MTTRASALAPVAAIALAVVLGLSGAIFAPVTGTRLLGLGVMAVLGMLAMLLFKSIFHIAVFAAFALMGILVTNPEPTDVLIVACLVVGAVTGHLRLAPRQLPQTLRLGLALFLLSYATSVLSGSLILRTVNWAFVGSMVFRVALFVFIVAYVTSYRALRVVFAGYLVSGLFSGVVALLGTMGLLSWEAIQPAPGEVRVSALMRDPNVLGAYLVPLAIWLLDEILWPKLWKGYLPLKVAAIALILLTIVLTLSRGTWLNLAVGLTVYTILELAKPRPRKAGRIVGLAVVLALLGAWALARTGYIEWIMWRLGEGDTNHLLLLRMGLDLAFRSPLGVGPGQSQSVMYGPPHNLFAFLAAENGWIALVAFLMVAAVTIWTLMRRTRAVNDPLRLSYQVVLASFMGLLANALVIDVVYWRMLWFLLGLAFASTAAQREVRTQASAGTR